MPDFTAPPPPVPAEERDGAFYLPGTNLPLLEQLAGMLAPISILRPDPTNPRTQVNIEALMESIKAFGVRWPVVVNRRTGVIEAGHQRVDALRRLGVQHVPVLWADDDGAMARAFMIADNRVGEVVATWDEEALTALLADLHDDATQFIAALGFDEAELAQRLGKAADDGGDEDEDDGPEPQFDRAAELQKQWGTERGQLWQLGNHRLLCGDSTIAADVARLMGGDKMQVVFTSPPYASQRKYDPESGFKPIHPDEYVDWWEAIQANIAAHLAPDGSFFLNIKEHCEDKQRHLYVKDLTIAHVRRWGWLFVDEFAWTHGGTPRAVVNRFKNGWEPVFQFTRDEHKFRPDNVAHISENAILWTSKSGHPADKDGHGWRGKRQIRTTHGKGEGMGGMQGHGDAIGAHGIEAAVGTGLAYPSNVVSAGKNTESLGHGAAFPVLLPEFFIKAYSDPGDIVYEPFCGSASTIIACERTGRCCRAIEISPQYVAICIQRWVDATGGVPTLVGHAE